MEFIFLSPVRPGIASNLLWSFGRLKLIENTKRRLVKTAEAMDIELDDDELSDSEDEG